MASKCKGKVSDDGKPKGRKNTKMPTESNVKGSYDAKKTGMRSFQI